MCLMYTCAGTCVAKVSPALDNNDSSNLLGASRTGSEVPCGEMKACRSRESLFMVHRSRVRKPDGATAIADIAYCVYVATV